MIRPARTRVFNILSEGPPQTVRSPRLQALDRALDRDPDAIEARAERAGLLREQGAFEEAKQDYLELLRRRPTDFAALNDFGTLVLNAGYREAARSLFGEAVRHHPANANGHVNLANLLFLIGEPEQARNHFEVALKLDPNHIHAHRGMGNLLAAIGDAAGARRHRDMGFRNHALNALPYRGEGAPISVLLLVSAAGGNIPTSTLLDDRYFQTTVLVTEYFDPGSVLPPHDLVFNSIGDADLCREGLEAAGNVLSRTMRPVINQPSRVLDTGRVSNVERLRGLSNVIVPRMVTLPRDTLIGPRAADVIAGCGLAFPFLVRAPGFHTGHHFAHVSTLQELAPAVVKFPGDDVWLIERLDARDGEGLFRKCRAMFVDRTLYPLHLAISRHWKVHYFTADMADSEEHRAKDQAFLEDMAGVIAPGGMAGLERIRATLGLDYGGIDFAVNPRGDILFFEANATMVVYPPSLDPKWAYRRPAVEAVLAAVRTMLTERSIAARAA
ncbi:MAG TPA: tetratricopeptide repeat protein [Xanthobacteraceae bacterium]